MKRLLSVLPLVLVMSAHAQFRHVVFSDWTTGYTVGIHGRYQLAGNAIYNNLIWDAYQGKSLSRDRRERVSRNLKDLNTAGFDLDYGIYAKHLPDSSRGIGWYVNIADRSHSYLRFPRDLFDITMFGNAGFAGSTADLSDIWFNLITYKQFEAGILKSLPRKNGTWHFGVGLSLLTGNRNLHIDIEQASMYTDPSGEHLDGEIHGSLRSSSLSSTQFLDDNGIGFGTAAHVSYLAERFGISFEASDLGMIRWSKRLQNVNLDSVFVFDGLEIDLFAADGNPFSSVSLDTAISGFSTRMPVSAYNSTLPGRFLLEGHYDLNRSNWKLYAGIQYRLVRSYLPYFYVGTSSPLPKGFYLDGHFGYGGIGSWNIGLELRKRFKDVAEIRIGTNNLEGYVIPMFGTSQSAYLSIAGFF